MEQARQRQAQLTKPPGSLGRLERLAIQIAGITARPRPRLPRKAIILTAADHGVAAEGVSAYPSTVTAQMVRNFSAGGAAINVLARQAGARVVVVDVGVSSDLPRELPIVHRKVAYGTANMLRGPAMTADQVTRALEVGAAVAEAEIARGLDLVGLGEMGIGNTTSASAIVATLTSQPVATVTGRGTGIDDAIWCHKVGVIERALEVNHPNPDDPMDVLAKIGGLEIAALVGVALRAAERQVPVVLDGFIATAAALIAAELSPNVRSYLIAAHRSAEPGHHVALQRLELEPLFTLDLRLGEGTGAALAMPVIDTALAILDEMATFDEAGVSGASSEPAPRDVSRS